MSDVTESSMSSKNENAEGNVHSATMMASEDTSRAMLAGFAGGSLLGIELGPRA